MRADRRSALPPAGEGEPLTGKCPSGLADTPAPPPASASLAVKRLPAMQETRVQSLGQEDPLEEEMATHSSTLAWRIPWTEVPGRLQSMTPCNPMDRSPSGPPVHGILQERILQWVTISFSRGSS